MGQIGNDVEYDELRRQHRDALRTIAEQAARIAALESALAERERERDTYKGYCDRLNSEMEALRDSILTAKMMTDLRVRAEAAESALAAARDDHRTWPTATSGCQAEPHMVSESELAALRSRADDEGRVERERKEVAWFAEQMERKLKMNDHKSHWTNCERDKLLETK
jgi:chromosome segregation ATPase